MVESWDEVQEYWWNNCHSPWFEGTVVHVIDKPKPKPKGLNEFISRRKNHRFSVDYLCVFCYTTCITFYGAIMHIIADMICIPFYVQNKQWDVAIMLAFLMSIAISKVAILL